MRGPWRARTQSRRRQSRESASSSTEIILAPARAFSNGDPGRTRGDTRRCVHGAPQSTSPAARGSSAMIRRLCRCVRWSSSVVHAHPSVSTGGAFRNVHPAELGAVAARAALTRAGVEPAAVDDVWIGHGRQAGSGPNPAASGGPSKPDCRTKCRPRRSTTRARPVCRRWRAAPERLRWGRPRSFWLVASSR